MDREEMVTIENVATVSDGLVLTCEVNRRRFDVPPDRIATSSQVKKFGDRGRLVIPRQVAADLGMLGA